MISYLTLCVLKFDELYLLFIKVVFLFINSIHINNNEDKDQILPSSNSIRKKKGNSKYK